MKEEVTALELLYLTKEFSELIGSRVEKVYAPDDTTIQLVLFTKEGKKFLHITSGKRVYVGTIKSANPEEPTGFCSYLRKQLTYTKIINITQIGFERILKIDFETKTGILSLYAELFSPGNIILCENNVIKSSLLQQTLKERTIRPKQPYILPEQRYDISCANHLERKNHLKKANKPLLKALATDFSLGGTYAEEIILRTGAKKDMETTDLSDSLSEKIILEIEKILLQKITPQIVFENTLPIDIIPFAMQKYASFQTEETEKLNTAFDKVYTQKSADKKVQDIETKKDKEIEKIQNTIKIQKKQFEKIKKESDENQRKGELLYEKYHVVEEILKQISAAKKIMSFKDMKEKLKGHAIIKEIDETNGDVTVEL